MNRDIIIVSESTFEKLRKAVMNLSTADALPFLLGRMYLTTDDKFDEVISMLSQEETKDDQLNNYYC